MKVFALIIASFFAISAQAGDRKVGNVIAVEREITNVYESCVQNITGDTTKQRDIFVCNFSFLKSPNEVSLGKGGVIRYKDDACVVNADTGNGVVLVVFGPAKGTTTLDHAKVCLQRALQNNNSVTAVIYTVE